MNPWIYVFSIPLFLVFLYYAVRLASAAYFKSKSEHLKEEE